MKLGLSEKLQQALNEQVTREYEAAWIYNGMRVYLDDLGAYGAKKWMKVQVGEEMEHAQDFIDIILELDGEVKIGSLPEIETKYDSMLAVWEAGLEHEKFISESILNILEIAIEEKNYAVENFLRTYVDEQVEEEDNFRGVIDFLKLAGDDTAALLKVDSVLGKRGE